jgi:predicted CoA-binding protein
MGALVSLGDVEPIAIRRSIKIELCEIAKPSKLSRMPHANDAKIDAFLAGDSFAVVGASKDRQKYGNKVLRSYLQAGRRVFPVNPIADEIEGRECYPDLASLPERVHGVSIITPPAVTEQIVEQAAAAGIEHLWMQPGAESPKAIARAEELGLSLIHSGPCALVVQGFRDV